MAPCTWPRWKALLPADQVFSAVPAPTRRPLPQVFHRMDELMRSKEGLGELEVLRREGEGGERGPRAARTPRRTLRVLRAGERR